MEKTHRSLTAPLVATVAAVVFHIALILVIQGMTINLEMGGLGQKGMITKSGNNQSTLKSVFDSTHISTAKGSPHAVKRSAPELAQIDDTPLLPTAQDIPDIDLSLETENELIEQIASDTPLLQPVSETLTQISQVASDCEQITESVMQATSKVEGIALPHIKHTKNASKQVFNQKQTFFEEQSTGSSSGQGGEKIAGTGDFVSQVTYAPSPDGGYYFRIAITARPDRSFKQITHNVFFLLDRSYSIANKRFNASKKAILHALTLLRPGDTFNILVFDNKVRRMTAKSLPWCPQSLEHAESFLKGQRPGGLMAGTDLYASLDTIIPKAVADTEINTAILLSDGDTRLKRAEQRQTVGLWSKQNNGKVSLFSFAAGSGNNLPLLDLLSQNNRGFLAYCKSRHDIDTTLYNLVDAINHPIGKDLIVTAVPAEGTAKLTIYPRKNRLPDLFQDRPYILYGKIDKLCDIFLFLQGKFYDHWFDIKEQICFDKATREEATTLQQNITMHAVYDQYDKFIADGQEKHLHTAQTLLQPYQIPPAFR